MKEGETSQWGVFYQTLNYLGPRLLRCESISLCSVG